ncbi:MAG: hypothetical protein SOU50_00640 [Oscillospiraceae bacterium]|nr:hypothetical protein [Oscillospiraceae bacterium]MDY2846712.1 hypothetical protein [Oscillospiraceae bacterium]
MQKAVLFIAAAAMTFCAGGNVVYAEAAQAVPETGNIGVTAYIVPVALAAVTVIAKKKNKK